LSDVVVRLAAIDDTAGVADVLREAFESYRPLYTPEAFAATTPSAAPAAAVASSRRCRITRGPPVTAPSC
jgi:hypothetical protein